MRRKILFRADAGQSIGYGHFIRTLALADMLKNDFDCVFYTQEPSEYQKREMEAVCPFRALPADDTRFGLFLNQLEGDEIVVLDNYFYTTDYQKKIKEKGCKLVCIDDMHDKHYVADIVINHGLVVKPDDFDCEPYTMLALGANYILLRSPFLQPLKYKQRENLVVVNFGGSDPYCFTEKVVSMLLEINVPYEITTILGDKTYLSEENKKRVRILRNLSANQMADLFEVSAFGILPLSTVFLEAISRGLPLMTGYFADNQAEGYKIIENDGVFIPLGDFSSLTAERLESSILKLHNFKVNIPDFTSVPRNFVSLFKRL